ncbi:MAG: hypothetical protein WBL25_00170, partial [Anaerolineales bacterium]
SKVDSYREILKNLEDWDEYLRGESNLPGPRGNLELAHAAADLEDRTRVEHFLGFTPQRAPVNTPDEFLAFCGVEGLGRLIAEGQTDLWPTLHVYASDPRWRIREAVAMALQRVGMLAMDLLLDKVGTWAEDNWLEMRATAAGLVEPKLLRENRHTGILGIPPIPAIQQAYIETYAILPQSSQWNGGTRWHLMVKAVRKRKVFKRPNHERWTAVGVQRSGPSTTSARTS